MLHEQGYAIENFHLKTKKTFLFNNQKVYLMNNGARISKTKRKMIQKCIDKKSNTIRGDFSHVLKDANKWEGFNINTTIAGVAILWSKTAIIRLKFVNVSELQGLTIGIHHVHTYTYFYLHMHDFGDVYIKFYCFQNFSCSYNFILFKVSVRK